MRFFKYTPNTFLTFLKLFESCLLVMYDDLSTVFKFI